MKALTVNSDVLANYLMVSRGQNIGYAREQVDLDIFRRLVDFIVAFFGNEDFKKLSSVGALCAGYDILKHGTLFVVEGEKIKFSFMHGARLTSCLARLVLYSGTFHVSKGLFDKYMSIAETVQDISDIMTSALELKTYWDMWKWLCNPEECFGGRTQITDGYERPQTWHVIVLVAVPIIRAIGLLAHLVETVCNLTIRVATLSVRIQPYTERVATYQKWGYHTLIAMIAINEIVKFIVHSRGVKLREKSKA